ncbi:MAG: hypothetical protein COA78_18305 [Blastopirellula sp.]|nr:MAG: hypothetical protein COA78_18305 [Blastopirellula sp.]
MRAAIQRLLDQYLPENVDAQWFHSSGIPSKKRANAIRTYAQPAINERVLALADGTVFGSAKEGLIITDQTLYARTLDEKFSVPLSEVAGATRKSGFPNYSIQINTHAGEEHLIATCCFTKQQEKLIEFFDALPHEFSADVPAEEIIAGPPEFRGPRLAESTRETFDLIQPMSVPETVTAREINSALRLVEFCVPDDCEDIDRHLAEVLASDTEQVIAKGYCKYVGYNKRQVRGVFVVSNRRLRLFSMESGLKLVFVETTKSLLGKLPLPFIDSILGFFLFTIPGSLLNALRGGSDHLIAKALATTNEQLLSDTCPLRSVKEITWQQLHDVVSEVKIGTGVWTSFNFLNKSFGVSFVPRKLTDVFRGPQDIILDGTEVIEPLLQLVQSMENTLREQGVELDFDDEKQKISLLLDAKLAAAA